MKTMRPCVRCGIVLLGLLLNLSAGCRRAPGPARALKPDVAFAPREMADALHAVIAADRDAYAKDAADKTNEERFVKLHAGALRSAAASIQQNGAEFHYVLRSLQPINPRNAPETGVEKSGLEFVAAHPGTNFYSDESLGGRRYLTAVYADVATLDACADCHNRSGPRKDFRRGDVMGGLIVRVPLEF